MIDRSSESGVKINGGISFWITDIGGEPARRPKLREHRHFDVCIVGGGFTGLWTAYYLKRAQPDIQIAIVEKEFAGFGASGRNGGNLTGLFFWNRLKYLEISNQDRLSAMELAIRKSVDEVIRVTQVEGMDADIVHAGNLAVATTAAQCVRIKARYDDLLNNRGMTEDEITFLDANELKERVVIAGAMGAIFNKNSARIQPAKLARGLAAVVEKLGVTIFEDTQVIKINPFEVVTEEGRVKADFVVRATEGFTSGIPGFERETVPLNSAMLVTRPVPNEIWKEIRWSGRETVSENSYAYNYCQRTRDGRVTIGGRGVPYRFGSRMDNHGETQVATIQALKRDLKRLFPRIADIGIDQAWCGVLGVPRDWCASVGLNPDTGYAWAGGYAGGGVAISNLAGRTLTDLILKRKTELTTFPWVNMNRPKWEIEPFRWLGIHTTYKLYRLADHQERKGGEKCSIFASLANKISGANR